MHGERGHGSQGVGCAVGEGHSGVAPESGSDAAGGERGCGGGSALLEGTGVDVSAGIGLNAC